MMLLVELTEWFPDSIFDSRSSRFLCSSEVSKALPASASCICAKSSILCMVRGGFFFCSRRFSFFPISHSPLSEWPGHQVLIVLTVFLFFFFSDHTSITSRENNYPLSAVRFRRTVSQRELYGRVLPCFAGPLLLFPWVRPAPRQIVPLDFQKDFH